MILGYPHGLEASFFKMMVNRQLTRDSSEINNFISQRISSSTDKNLGRYLAPELPKELSFVMTDGDIVN